MHKLPLPEIIVIEKDTSERVNIFNDDNTKAKKSKSKFSISKWLFIIFVFVFLGGVFYFTSTYFEKVTITIQPKSKTFTFTNETFTASKLLGSTLGFEITVLSDKVSKDVTFIKSEDAPTYATGGVTLYNEYSTKSQIFPVNTKLSDINNNIYKLDKAVTIPGYKTSKGKIIPGSISTMVTAIVAGDAYNGDPRDFSLPILKNTLKYKKIYGRSNTPLSGGQQGSTYVLSPETKGELDGFAHSSFNQSILRKIQAQIPFDYVFYSEGTNFSYLIDDKSQLNNPRGKVSIEGTLTAVLLNKKDLENSIINHIIPNITSSELNEITVSNLESLSFKFNDSAQVINKDTKSFAFTLSGTGDILWHPDENKLKENLLGISKNSIQEVLKTDPGVEKASAKFSPPWQSYIPNNLERIHIIINNLTSN